MIRCPFCQSDLEEKMTICRSCNAKKGYLQIENFVFGKSLLIFLGLIIPFMLILFAISAQNLFGLWMSAILLLPVLFTIWHLLIGPRWLK